MSTEKHTYNQPYEQSNDKATFMSDLQRCMKKLESKGYNDQFRVEGKYLVSLSDNGKKFKADDVNAINFYRFEGISNPDDMSILYAIETTDGHKGTLVDAYGTYADEATGAFMQAVPIQKKAASTWTE